MGRWINEDPIGFDAGDFSLVRYVKNSPVSSKDSNGKVTDKSQFEETRNITKVYNAITFLTRRLSTSPWESHSTGQLTVSMSEPAIHGGLHGPNDFLLGMNFVSEFAIGCSIKCRLGGWGGRTPYYYADFKYAVIVVKNVLPTTSGGATIHTWEHWLANFEGVMGIPWPSNFTRSVQGLETIVLRHENHHFQTYKSANSIIKTELGKFEKRQDTPGDADNDCDDGITKATTIWSAAITHSGRYEDEWLEDSFSSTISHPFTYP